MGDSDEKEADKRRDAVLRRMLSTPPKPREKDDTKVKPEKRESERGAKNRR